MYMCPQTCILYTSLINSENLLAALSGSPAAGALCAAMLTTKASTSSAVLALEAGHRLHGAGILPHRCQDAHDVVWNDSHRAPCITSSESVLVASNQYCLHSHSAARRLSRIGLYRVAWLHCRGNRPRKHDRVAPHVIRHAQTLRCPEVQVPVCISMHLTECVRR